MAVYVVGVDVSRAELVVVVHLPSGEMRDLGIFANTPEGWEQLAHTLASLPSPGEAATIHLVMEPTGGYEQPLARFAEQQGWRISLPHPRHVRDWARGMGRRAKTDRVDAKVLAAYGAATAPPTWQPLPAEVEELEALLQRRAELQEALQQEHNRCHALKAQGPWHGAVAASLEAHLAFREQALQDLEREIRNHLDRHPHLKEEVARLRQMPGIAARNSLPILVLLYRLSRQRQGLDGLRRIGPCDPSERYQCAPSPPYFPPRQRPLPTHLVLGRFGWGAGPEPLAHLLSTAGATREAQDGGLGGRCSQTACMGLGRLPGSDPV